MCAAIATGGRASKIAPLKNLRYEHLESVAKSGYLSLDEIEPFSLVCKSLFGVLQNPTRSHWHEPFLKDVCQIRLVEGEGKYVVYTTDGKLFFPKDSFKSLIPLGYLKLAKRVAAMVEKWRGRSAELSHGLPEEFRTDYQQIFAVFPRKRQNKPLLLKGLKELVSGTGWSPGTVAATEGHADVIRALAEAGVNLSAEDGDGCTPATVAAFRGHADVIDALAKAGVDLNAADGRGRTPASIAVSRLDDSLIALLIS